MPTGIVRPSRCLTGDIFGELVKGNFIYVPSVMVRRRCFEQIGLFALDLPGTEDWDAWLRLSAISRVDAVQEPVGVYRDFSRQSGQMSSNRPRMLKSSARTQCRALRSPRGLTLDCATRRGLRSEFLNRIWDELIREGHLSVSDGDYSGAAMNYLTAAELYPSRAMRSALRYLTRIVHQVA